MVGPVYNTKSYTLKIQHGKTFVVDDDDNEYELGNGGYISSISGGWPVPLGGLKFMKKWFVVCHYKSPNGSQFMTSIEEADTEFVALLNFSGRCSMSMDNPNVKFSAAIEMRGTGVLVARYVVPKILSKKLTIAQTHIDVCTFDEDYENCFWSLVSYSKLDPKWISDLGLTFIHDDLDDMVVDEIATAAEKEGVDVVDVVHCHTMKNTMNEMFVDETREQAGARVEQKKKMGIEWIS